MKRSGGIRRFACVMLVYDVFNFIKLDVGFYMELYSKHNCLIIFSVMLISLIWFSTVVTIKMSGEIYSLS